MFVRIILTLAALLSRSLLVTAVSDPTTNNTSLTEFSQCMPSAITPLVDGTVIVDVTANTVQNYATGAMSGNYLPATPAANISFCNITIVYTHPGWGDRITLYVNLPLHGWNGRFIATGGGGLVTGPTPEAMHAGVYLGYATAGTDGGHVGMDMDWAILKNGSLINYPTLLDFASTALADMAILGRHVAEAYYAQPVKYTYWSGCSTGGRQGLMMAQRYSHLFDGIVANAPAINWSEVQLASMWPQVVMYMNGTAPPNCVLQAFTNAAIDACDTIDGVQDGVISLPGLCNFDPYSIVGSKVNCNSTLVTITSDYAFVVSQYLLGPHTANGTRLWYGFNQGSDFTGLGGTTCAGTATNCTALGAMLSSIWVANFLVKDASYDAAAVTYQQFYDCFSQSKQEYDWMLATNDADLRHLRRTKTKVLTFHGLADPAIFSNGTVDYYERELEYDRNATDYHRFFLAPGVQHCGGGYGPNPSNMFTSLVEWVEHGKAPRTLDAIATAANGTVSHRPLCLYPAVAEYMGGDPKLTSSYKCPN